MIPKDSPAPPVAAADLPMLGLRGLVGGCLMGVANLVPGISGGAMLIMVGIYTRFITGVAELATFRFRAASLVAVGSVGVAAMLTILVLAGVIKDVVLDYTWQVYALLIGMRLGVVPMIYKLAKPVDRSFWIGAGCGVLITLGVAVFRYTTTDFGAAGASSPVLYFLAGLFGASATLLPGLDGSYVLMLMGQYVPILASIDRFKDALTDANVQAAMKELWVLVPTGLGVACGIGGVSLALRWLLAHRPKPTFGVLVGILVGAVIGLFPFQRSVQPEVGQSVRGQLMTPEVVAVMPRDEWPVLFFSPTPTQIAAAVGLAVLGFGLALLIEKISPKAD